MPIHSLMSFPLVALLLAAAVVVVAETGGKSQISHTPSHSGVERNRTESLNPVTNPDDGEMVTLNEENNEDEEEEGGDEEEENEARGRDLMNLIESAPEVVTMKPENATITIHDFAPPYDLGEGRGRGRRKRPKDTAKDRKERRRRRRRRRRRKKLRNKKAKKFYRGNQLYKMGTTKQGGGSGIDQSQWISPNKHSGWAAGQSFRSLDPRRVKVKRHLVRQHNLLRAHVDPPAADMLAVKWYKTAADQAQGWAEQCGHHDNPEHPSVRWTSSYGVCGQNVFVSPTKKRWSEVLDHWWGGKKHFQYGGPATNNSLASAYTQMAWYNSHQVGCGYTQCHAPGGNTFYRYVCNYCPAGNNPYRETRPYTEGASCSMCPEACRSLCRRRRCSLCTNACTYSDLWVNCGELDQVWHEWLCNTKTTQGVERFKSCRATCQCANAIT